MVSRFTRVPPPISTEETATQYAYRLERIGYDEMRIRKEVFRKFPGDIFEKSYIFNDLSDAGIRYVTTIHQLTPKKPRKGLVKKLSASLEISEDEAERSVRRYKKIGGLPFIPWRIL